MLSSDVAVLAGGVLGSVRLVHPDTFATSALVNTYFPNPKLKTLNPDPFVISAVINTNFLNPKP